ncbi:hypothetical protein MMC16_006680 [Acarospora aff. strigata]|nr:hypothetical protein [Acarospora aff. strigata]
MDLSPTQSLLWKLLYAILISAAHAIADNVTNPVSSFQSRPDLAAPALSVSINNASFVSPGYIFLAPFQSTQPGPYIYDSTGNLIWSGFGAAAGATVHDFRTCTYKGSDHLCFFQGNQLNGYAKGLGVLMDNTYNVVNTIRTSAGETSADMHELNVINGGESALMTMYMPVQHDLSANGITSGQGWILEGSFQEVNTGTQEILFDWRSLSYVDPSLGYVAPNTTNVSGDGLTQDTAWDYIHINSVDKNAEGDYLVSARHTSTVYKISHLDGSIIWKLGGKQSTFALKDFNFSMQHDARFVSEDSTTTVISLFDNASDGFSNTASDSTAMLISINNSTNEATLLKSYIAPNGGILSVSQGNFQRLPNGNVFLGWGSNASISEHTPDDNPVLFATFASEETMNYRAFKLNWTAAPTTPPALYSYAHNNTAPTSYYASWNGATEVAAWRFYTGSSTTSPFTLVGNTTKAGFETVYTTPGFQTLSIVEAVAANGTALANSSIISTFVPGPESAGVCSDTQCPPGKGL